MALNETYQAWLNKQVGEINPTTTYEIEVSSKEKDSTPMLIKLDLVWYILLQITDELQTKLDVALALLQDNNYQQQFKATQTVINTKRILTEFLLSNFICLTGLQKYLNFKDLDQPVDFITHALLFAFTEGLDTPEIEQKRVMIVELVLDSGFTLDTREATERATGGAVRKVLLLDAVASRFKLLRRLLKAGFSLLSADPVSNSEVAVLLINHREDPNCLEIIKQHRAQLSQVKVRVAGDSSSSNLADYYYWVREDMETVGFIREVLGIDISK